MFTSFCLFWKFKDGEYLVLVGKLARSASVGEEQIHQEKELLDLVNFCTNKVDEPHPSHLPMFVTKFSVFLLFSETICSWFIKWSLQKYAHVSTNFTQLPLRIRVAAGPKFVVWGKVLVTGFLFYPKTWFGLFWNFSKRMLYQTAPENLESSLIGTSNNDSLGWYCLCSFTKHMFSFF